MSVELEHDLEEGEIHIDTEGEYVSVTIEENTILMTADQARDFVALIMYQVSVVESCVPESQWMM